ncbi:MAG TPA: NlpC/P60 family protein [Phycisphaerae bacterium]|nr:C40 family peptidase [Phycisphaerales bacterium]HRX86520.1 NlpC/P60 family protein [Phycisphaerae bacterium]
MQVTVFMLVAALAAGERSASTPSAGGRAAHAVATYQPFNIPDGADLRGLRVGLDWTPADDDASADCARRLSLTAGYLFHIVRRRGGELVLSHAPGEDALESAAGRAQRVSTLASARCDLVLVLHCPSPPPTSVPDTAEQPWLASLTGWTARPGGNGQSDSAMEGSESLTAHCPVVNLHVPDAPAKSTPTWQTARTDALALTDALARYAADDDRVRPSAPGEPLPGAGRAARLARQLWPNGDLPPERAAWLCSFVRRISLSNPSLVYARVDVQQRDDRVVLTGAASSPCVGNMLEAALLAVGVNQVTDEIRSLPDRSRLGDRLFGACRVSSVLTRVAPDEHAGLQTELLYGEPVFLLDRQGGYVLLQGGDGYWGWTRADAIEPMDQAAFAAYTAAPEAVLLHDVDSNGVHIPRGARVRLARQSTHGSALKLPDGETLRVPHDALEIVDTAETAARRVDAALDLLHTPYVFGGRSPEGLDCSGLAGNVAARSGTFAARDANQQALAGRLTATAWYRAGMQAGDQVFFIDQSGKIYHTGIALDATHIIHSAPPGVQIGTFVRGDRLYDARIDRDFFIAKRP